uniref:Cysteine-rich receptor-like protein kinase 43 n=1 Tax=Nelumbo nucifera TaxID=4432 RepID=A0A822YPT7_NELNU|nr:TPA_asm: hypothetical protein HUJ06_005167 [Nelumbo nucifera]
METRLIYILLFMPLLKQLVTKANPRTDIVARICGNVTSNDSRLYVDEFTKTLKIIKDEIYMNGFGTAVVGEGLQQIYVMAQCHGDLTYDDCVICTNFCLTLLPGCFPKTAGRIYLDGCFARFDSYDFFNESVLPSDSSVCGMTESTTPIDFNATIKLLLDRVVKIAVTNHGYGDGSERWGSGSVFALANCWKTLNEESCLSCLQNAATNILTCLPSTEGRAVDAGCFLRYSDYKFLNDNEDLFSRKGSLFSFTTFVFVFATVCILSIFVGICLGDVIYKGLHRQRRRKAELDVVETSMFARTMHFKYSTLEKATDYFSQANKLGNGGYGEVFKGTLGDGREIAIKRLYVNYFNRNQEIHNEINIISRATHRNLARFLGFCITNEADPEKKKELDWNKRLNIIMGTAEGLEYLHKRCDVTIVHRDVKASNILLDLRYRPKIADFGLARFCSTTTEKTTENSANIAGTLGYMAPEYITRGLLTDKADVYSFGILILEIVGGIQNNKFQPDNSLDTLVTCAWRHFQSNTVSEIIDESLEIEDIEEVTRIVQVGLLCTQESLMLRPEMTEVIQMIKRKDLEIPRPSKPPFICEPLNASGLHSSPSSNTCTDYR